MCNHNNFIPKEKYCVSNQDSSTIMAEYLKKKSLCNCHEMEFNFYYYYYICKFECTNNTYNRNRIYMTF